MWPLEPTEDSIRFPRGQFKSEWWRWKNVNDNYIFLTCGCMLLQSTQIKVKKLLVDDKITSCVREIKVSWALFARNVLFSAIHVMDIIQNLLIVGLSLSQATLILSLEFPKIKIILILGNSRKETRNNFFQFEKNYSGFLFMTTRTRHYPIFCVLPWILTNCKHI